MVRIPLEIHRRLALEAEEEGIRSVQSSLDNKSRFIDYIST